MGCVWDIHLLGAALLFYRSMTEHCEATQVSASSNLGARQVTRDRVLGHFCMSKFLWLPLAFFLVLAEGGIRLHWTHPQDRLSKSSPRDHESL